MHGFDVYRTYLAMKLHFSNDKFDFFQYDGKVNAKEETYQQRNDFYFFETVARKYDSQEIKEYMLASFVEAENPTKVWIGDIKSTGKDRWLVWAKRQQSLAYLVEQDLDTMVKHLASKGDSFNSLFETLGGHPPLLKFYIRRDVSLETLVVLDMVLGFMVQWDRELNDPLWEQLSFKIKKYKPFLSIQTNKFRTLMRNKFM